MKTLTLILSLLFGTAAAFAAHKTPAEIHLWPDGAPGFENRAHEKEIITTRVEPDISFPVTSNIHNPSLTPYLPHREWRWFGWFRPHHAPAPRAAVIIAPGGAHRFLTMDREGYDLGKWLSERGIAAFVLKYRLARETNSVYKIDVHALADARRAIRLIRFHAKEWNINPDAVGILGFSAGGEVAALSAMRPENGDPAAPDAIERLSSQPDFEALIYPGSSRTSTVTSNSPPAFLACASDDRPDISQGLAEVYLKFKQAGVPVELHIYTKGGHGFGVRNRPLAVSTWQFRFRDWLADLGFVKNSSKK